MLLSQVLKRYVFQRNVQVFDRPTNRSLSSFFGHISSFTLASMGLSSSGWMSKDWTILVSRRWICSSATRRPTHDRRPWPKGRLLNGWIFSRSSAFSHRSGTNSAGLSNSFGSRPIAQQTTFNIVCKNKRKYLWIHLYWDKNTGSKRPICCRVNWKTKIEIGSSKKKVCDLPSPEFCNHG